MIEITILGRRGRGGVTLATLIAAAYFLRGRYRINARPDDTPLDDYLGRQGRFRSVAPSLDDLRAQVDRDWPRLDGLARAFPATD